MRTRSGLAVALCTLSAAAVSAHAGVVFGLTPGTLGNGYRWDAAPRTVNLSGQNYERSLNGGLRFSLQGGSYQSYRDLFAWNVVPSVAAFTTAVNQAFSAWTATDPATGLVSGVSFTADLNTPVVGVATGGLDLRGAEIDLFGSNDGTFWDPGNNGTQGETYFNGSGSTVQLTSGTVGYNSIAINGADIRMNSNPGAVYTLDVFRRILTHEIGHAIGLGDVEGDINPGAFIDDNYNGSSSATTLATLTNSWALLVDTANPANSPLSRFTVPYADPGTQTVGVDILMESRGVGIGASNPVTNLTPLTNDDYGTRQFLYPTPTPGASFIGLLGFGMIARRRRSA